MPLYPPIPIAAIATAPGRGGIGVIRVSGPELKTVIQTLFARPLQPRYAHYLPFTTAQGEVIDEGLALYFPAPHSYTGEDVLELQGHGGPAVLKRVLARCLEAGEPLGMRLAEPGEFTQRAFLNERLDLAQAEAVADLIDASSEAAARGAMASLSGTFSRQVDALSERIIHLRMLVEATLDFPEEEIDFLEKYQARPALDGLRHALDELIVTSRQGQILREGLHVVLAGVPNVGKSSLLNALAGDDVAIVTPIAGTTRDRVIQNIHIDGVPLYIVDTAGLRQTEDEVERLGIERTWKEIQRADLILHMIDARDQHATPDPQIVSRLPAGTPVIRILNKIDLVDTGAEAASSSHAVRDSTPGPASDPVPDSFPDSMPNPESSSGQPGHLAISAKHGQGLDALRREILKIAGWNPGIESPWIARERHLQALHRAAHHLNLARDHAEQDDRVLDLFAEELRLAHQSLTAITGAYSSDDLLGEIFAGFCIGK